MNAPLRVAVVGAGEWGAQHARIFGRRSDTELCAIVARTPAKAASRGQVRGSGQDLADHPAVHVGESAPDAVVVEAQALVIEAE